jgi:hypothetical protein
MTSRVFGQCVELLQGVLVPPRNEPKSKITTGHLLASFMQSMERLGHHRDKIAIAGGHRKRAFDLVLGAQGMGTWLAVHHNVIEQTPTNALLQGDAHNRHRQSGQMRAGQQMTKNDGGNPVLEQRASAPTGRRRHSALLRHHSCSQ